MENAEKIKKTHAFASGYHQGIKIVAEYMKNRSELISTVILRPDTELRDTVLKGLWLRSRAWLQTLEILNHTRHVQAISVANRALLEITVDMILIHHDKTNATAWKLYQWGESERMKAAEQLVNFYKEKHLPVPEEDKPIEVFYKEQKAMVDHLRRSLWPNKKDPSKAEHPKRWTGRSDLSKDVEEADKLYGSAIQADLGMPLTEYYRTEYRRMNWQIHSGLAGVWNLSPETFNIICGFALKWCADFAMLCTKIILTDFGFETALAGLKDEWENVKQQRGIAYFNVTRSDEEDSSE
jgi:hypothetical protein